MPSFKLGGRSLWAIATLLHLIAGLSHASRTASSSAFGFASPFARNGAATANVDGGGGGKGKGNDAPLSKIPVVICPGFGNDQIDYSNPLKQGEDYGFVSALARRGFDPELIRVLPLERLEWARVAGGLFDVPDFYTGNCRPTGLGYGWYVRRLRKTIQEAFEEAGSDERVVLIAHSAGGWLARAALGDGSWDLGADDAAIGTGSNGGAARASDRVRALFTIGGVHKPPAGDAASTCVTRGALSYLDRNFPGAFLAGEGISYVSVGGDAVLGRKEQQQPPSASVGDEAKEGSQEVNDVYKVRGEGSASSVAYTSYTAVSGDGEMSGDGVVPLEWSLLEGSRTIVLDGVLHSINEAGTTMPTNKWYGAEEVVDRWLSEALEEAGIKDSRMNYDPLKIMLEKIIPGL